MNEFADVLLLELLDDPDLLIVHGTFEIRLEHHSQIGLRKLLHRRQLLSENTKEIVARRSERLWKVFRDAVLHSDLQRIGN